MKSDNVAEIGIDNTGKLYIAPQNEQFTLIWRSATEVHWDTSRHFLYSPTPREWSYLDWYHYIIKVIKDECGCTLILTNDTKWNNIPDQLRNEIIQS